MQAKLTKEDFDALQKVKGYYKKYFSKKTGYQPPRFRKISRDLQKPIWNKLNELKKELQDQYYFQSRFKIHLCMPHKRSTGSTKGHIRPNLWLSLVDLKSSEKSKDKKDLHQRLPQIQITINDEFLITASVYIEAYRIPLAEREKFINFIINNSLSKKYHLMVYDKKNENHIKNVRENDLHKYNQRQYCIAVEKRFIRKEILKNKLNLESLIKSDVQKIYDEVFSKCFRYKPSQNKKTNKKETKGQRGRTDEFDIKSSLRKGTEPVKVEAKHKKIQNELKHFLEKKHKKNNPILEFERDFVDLRLELPEQNKVILFEIKTDKTALNCIKHALGQLLFYNMALRQKEDNWKDITLIIVGLAKHTNMSKDFIRQIQNYIRKDNIKYRRFDSRKKVLLSEKQS